MNHTADTNPTPAPRSATKGLARDSRRIGLVLTLNEEHRLPRCLESLRRVCDTVLVVDSGSTDRTANVAAKHGAEFVVHAFEDYGTQRNWALQLLRERHEQGWVVSLDADEWLSDELVRDLNSKFRENDVDVMFMALRIRFDGKVLKHGGFASTRLPRVFRLEVGRYEDRSVNEHLSFDDKGRSLHLAGHLEHSDVNDWEHYIAKHNQYSTLEAQARIHKDLHGSSISLREALRRPDLRRRWLRSTVWDRLPGRPVVRFLQILVVSGGFLDGSAGLHRAIFESWQEMCTDLKAKQLRREAGTTRAVASPSKQVTPPRV